MEFSMILIFQILIYIFIVYALYRAFTASKRKRKDISEEATIIKKEYFRVSGLDLGYPKYDDSFEVTFQLKNKERTFVVSQFEYELLEEGDQGILCHDRYKIISFGDKLKKPEDS